MAHPLEDSQHGNRQCHQLQQGFQGHGTQQSQASCRPEEEANPLDEYLGPETDKDDEDDDEIQEVDVEEILHSSNSNEPGQVELPMHFRCTAHSLNLVATTDAKAALKSGNIYHTLHHKTFGKLTKIWSLQNCSTKFSDEVHDKPKKTLVTPTATRWNSTFDSVQRILKLRDSDSMGLAAVFDAGNVAPLKAQESAFLNEWAKVMSPLAMALDHLQGDSTMYLGYVLPMIIYLKSYLKEEMEAADKCKLLADVILKGVQKHFDPYLK